MPFDDARFPNALPRSIEIPPSRPPEDLPASDGDPAFSVTARKIPARRGRPAKTDALSNADRQRKHRENKIETVASCANALFSARDRGDWEAVERVARILMRI